MFLDEATVEFASGKGGSGAVGFHREKHVPRGGPNGADGGRGGDVVLVADRHRRTLYDFTLLDHYEAPSGTHAVGNENGKKGKTIEIKLPVGTEVRDVETGEIVVDLVSHGMMFLLCRGGKGGRGNQHYTSSVRQAPNFAEKGEPGERRRVLLQLKLIADVGLVGMPNAGKSTLVSRVSAAKPKIADYPFTTIVPNLGVVSHRQETFVIADMPGLIRGASEGIGLGHQFLRHVERNRVLVHVVDVAPVDESDPLQNYETIERELEAYSAEIFARPRLVALNKADLASPDELMALRERFLATGREVLTISGVTGQGLPALLDATMAMLREATPVEDAVVAPVARPPDEDAWEAQKVADGEFVVRGKRIERMVAMTDLEVKDAVRHLHRRLHRIGVIEALREAGIQEGDDVTIGEFEFAYTDLQ